MTYGRYILLTEYQFATLNFAVDEVMMMKFMR